MTERIDRRTAGSRPRASAVERGTAHAVRLAMISHYRRVSAHRASGRAGITRTTRLVDARAESAQDARA